MLAIQERCITPFILFIYEDDLAMLPARVFLGLRNERAFIRQLSGTINKKVDEPARGCLRLCQRD